MYAFIPALIVLILTQTSASAADWGLKSGNPELKSAGPLSFAVDGILIVGDPKAATVFAIDTGSAKGDASKVTHAIDGLGEKIGAALGVKEVTINDLAVNPATGQIILSVSAAGKPALVRIDEKGAVTEFVLKNVPFSKVTLPDAPEDKEVTKGNRKSNNRDESITDVSYINGRVLVAGLSNGQSPSSVRELAFPFDEGELGTSIEIYHAAHGRSEDNAVVRAFIPLTIGGETSVLAGFTCTPLVRFPITGIEPGKKIKGTTVAELGNRNKPLDMIAYEKDGKTWLLMANSARGVMKIDTDGITKNPGLTKPVGGGGTAGQTFTTIKELEGTVQLDKLNDTQAVIVIQKENALTLKTIPLP
jgi:hypothetical protein